MRRLSFEAELESMMRPYDVFEKVLWQFLKKMSIFLQTKGNNQKEIESYLQYLCYTVLVKHLKQILGRRSGLQMKIIEGV